MSSREKGEREMMMERSQWERAQTVQLASEQGTQPSQTERREMRGISAIGLTGVFIALSSAKSDGSD